MQTHFLKSMQAIKLLTKERRTLWVVAVAKNANNVI